MAPNHGKARRSESASQCTTRRVESARSSVPARDTSRGVRETAHADAARRHPVSGFPDAADDPDTGRGATRMALAPARRLLLASARVERREIIIVGGGPGGAATALFLARHDPGARGAHPDPREGAPPRPKVCAGGLIPHSLDCLDELGVGLTVPHVMVDRARVEVPAERVRSTGRASVRSSGAPSSTPRSSLRRGRAASRCARTRRSSASSALERVRRDRARDGRGTPTRRRSSSAPTAPGASSAAACSIAAARTRRSPGR